MPQKTILKHTNYEIFAISAGYLLLSSLILWIQVERGSFILIGVFLLCAILIARMCIRNFSETVITDESISIRTILLKKNRIYFPNDKKLLLIILRNNMYYSDRSISILYHGKVVSQYRFSNDSEMKKFYEVTRESGFGWKNKPK